MSSSSVSKLTTAKAVISTVGSIAATVMVARSIAKDYLPHEIQDYLFLGIQNFFKHFSSQLTIVIDEFDGLTNNEIYDAAAVYLGTKISSNSSRLKAMKHEKENSITLAVERNEEVSDIHNGAKFKWVWVCHQVQQASNPYNTHDSRSSFRSEVRCFQLMFHKKHKELALNSYLPFILKEATAMQQESKTLKIFTFDATIIYSDPHKSWKSVSLDHPATFDTLAMEPDTKEMVLQDLEMFVKRRDKYRRIGKAWKRGYLLYGPPGTGKSSLIAAIANYLKFDIYDLELTDLRHNSDLRRLLIATANRSILVVEDIDCTIELQERVTGAQTVHHRGFNHQEESKVTLSGFLNFIDGLWSSCGDERIIIFTTNHKEKLDPALLRPGRMDMHIHMSYCTPCGFRLLAANYLGIDNHELFGEIEEMIRTIEVTPAEVAEQLLKSDEPDASLNRLMSFLHGKSKEKEEAKAKELVDEESVGKGKENKQDNEIKE